MTIREQNLEDAKVLLNIIRTNPAPDLARIWSDLTDVGVADNVDRLTHIVNVLGLQ